METPDGRRRLRFHDYTEIFSIPGLYERLFSEELECRSPEVVCGLLDDVLADRGGTPADLRVLDVGAGNGMVGEHLAELGASAIVGVDIIEAAAMATARDRPGVYDEYHVVDLTDPAPEVDAALRDESLTCMTTVAALGFGDIPPAAFRAAFDMVAVDGFVAITLRDDFLSDGDTSGFAGLISSMLASGELEELGSTVYRHRLATSRDPLLYRAVVARKRRPRG